MTINSIGSSTALLGSLQQMENIVRGETTVDTPDGGSVTTVGTGKNANIVSVTSPGGFTATEVGYVSPVLLQGFLDSLSQALQSDGWAANTAASGATRNTMPSNATGSLSSGSGGASHGSDGVAASLETLIQQLGPYEPSTPANANLLASFDSLIKGSGIATSEGSQGTGGTTADQTAKTALQAFLSNAMPTLVGTSAEARGSSVNTSV